MIASRPASAYLCRCTYLALWKGQHKFAELAILGEQLGLDLFLSPPGRGLSSLLPWGESRLQIECCGVLRGEIQKRPIGWNGATGTAPPQPRATLIAFRGRRNTSSFAWAALLGWNLSPCRVVAAATLRGHRKQTDERLDALLARRSEGDFAITDQVRTLPGRSAIELSAAALRRTNTAFGQATSGKRFLSRSCWPLSFKVMERIGAIMHRAAFLMRAAAGARERSDGQPHAPVSRLLNKRVPKRLFFGFRTCH
jgi:hypothetical protein